MADKVSLLAALQNADSFFPGGATAFSWGLEALHADGHVRSPADVERFLTGQIERRWTSSDRVFLIAAHRAGGDLARVAEIDRRLAAMILPRELREGTIRTGGALLEVHRRLGTPGAEAYRRLIGAGEAHGCLAVVQGLLWSAIGLDADQAAAMSAHALCVGVVGAALRLGIIGHIEAQRIVSAVRPLAAAGVAAPETKVEQAHAFAPSADIAAMRHETQGIRLFAN